MNGTRRDAAPLPWWRRLHVRAAALVLLVLATLGLSTAWITWRQARDGALEAAQRQSLGLARTIADHLPEALVRADGTLDPGPVRALASHVMMLNPAAEVYLLDADGRVRAHALSDVDPARGDPTGRRVDVAPVDALLAGMGGGAQGAPMLPLFGTDPREPSHPAIFSVAALSPASAGGRPPGFLYVVLRPPGDAPFAASRTLQAALLALAAATLAAALALAAVLRRLVRPLDALTARVQAFRREDERRPAHGPRDEIALLDDALRRLQARVEQQIADLHEADRQRRELVGNISHDLRTPLSAIQGYVETVLLGGDRLDAATRAQHLHTVLRHADQLGRRIGALFELSTLEAGRVQPRLEVFCLAELLQDVVHGYEVDARRRDIVLTLDGGRHLATRVRADIALIERVLQNLIDNALRHTPPGGRVTVSLATPDGEAAATAVEVRIADTGDGIAPEHLPHIFERYWRGEEAAAGPGPGAAVPDRIGGLGLAIVRRILDLHGSLVQVRSAPREGSCFSFGLPRAA